MENLSETSDDKPGTGGNIGSDWHCASFSPSGFNRASGGQIMLAAVDSSKIRLFSPRAMNHSFPPSSRGCNALRLKALEGIEGDVPLRRGFTPIRPNAQPDRGSSRRLTHASRPSATLAPSHEPSSIHQCQCGMGTSATSYRAFPCQMVGDGGAILRSGDALSCSAMRFAIVTSTG